MASKRKIPAVAPWSKMIVAWRRAICVGFGFVATLAGATPTRPELSLDASWRFHFGAIAEPAKIAAEPADWTIVTLPHTWNARDGADGGADYAKGTGWYARRFRVDPSWAGRRIFLQFDGANRRTEVFMNGKRLGEHHGGFARFRFDVTDVVRMNEANVLVVGVSNADDGTPPLSADFTFFGGLYRGVKLFATDPVHIDALDFGADGFQLLQENVSAARAELTAKIKLRNDSASRASAVVQVELRGAGSERLAFPERAVELTPRSDGSCETHLALDRPHLWNGKKDPFLYTAVVTVRTKNETRDELAQHVGLRFFRVDPERGFFLNGEPLDLHGVSRHQDRAGKGWAISADDEREDFGFVKEIGATAVRVAHYPQSDLWFDLADENGLVVWAEIPIVNEVAATADYTDNAAQQLRELIRQHLNHPAICFWGVGNETRAVGDTNGHETPNAPAADQLIAQLNTLAHAEDPTRPTTYASHHRPDDVRNFHTDVLAFNRYQGWYGGRADDLAKWLDDFHAKHPMTAVGVSEYGAGANTAQHDLAFAPPKPGGPFHPEEYQSYLHERQWQILASRPYIWGKFIWNLFDFASDGRAEGEQPGLNDKGLVTYDRRTPKDAFFWYQANWSNEPMLHLVSRRFVDHTIAEVEIKVYSNAPQVELFLNGASRGVVAGPGRIFLWHEKLVPGENRIAVRAKVGARELTDECVWKLIESKTP